LKNSIDEERMEKNNNNKILEEFLFNCLKDPSLKNYVLKVENSLKKILNHD
jgi:hypothetical protein